MEKIQTHTHTKVCDIHRLHLCIPVCAFTETQSGWVSVSEGETEGPRGKGAVHKKAGEERRRGLLSVS